MFTGSLSAFVAVIFTLVLFVVLLFAVLDSFGWINVPRKAALVWLTVALIVCIFYLHGRL